MRFRRCGHPLCKSNQSGFELQEWSRLNGLHRIIVSHGDIIGCEAPIVLRELASGLAA